jgi:hypothetical protein
LAAHNLSVAAAGGPFAALWAAVEAARNETGAVDPRTVMRPP